MWRRKNYVEETQFDFTMNQLVRRMDSLEMRNFRQENFNATYESMIALLIEAGILVEKKENSAAYVEFGNQKYTIRKVK